jgi:predicted nuclease with RNAse H fold
MDQQNVYATLDLTSDRPTLYVASAAGASVARVLERISALDPTVRVVDTHPLGTHSQLLSSGATVTALREAVSFPAHQHAQPIAVLATWAAVLFAAMLLVSHRLGRSPGDP